MPVKIAIASGKGGTGKTTVSVNLYHYLKQNTSTSVQLIDCDVEEPNDVLFFKEYNKLVQEPINQLLPEIDVAKCSFCRKCVDYCEFNAIVILPSAGFAQINPSLCHSCGACTYACPLEGAIIEKPHSIAQLTGYGTEQEAALIEGRLNIGSAMQTQAIKELTQTSYLTAGIQLLDAPPGTSCPVVATLAQADYTLLVTEPSPFGLHDLKLMVDLLRELQQPFGVIINKSEDNFIQLDEYLQTERIDVLGKIPFSIGYARQYAKGQLFEHTPECIAAAYRQIIIKLQHKLLQDA